MEFFEVANIDTTVATIQAITVGDLDKYCSDIDRVLTMENKDLATIYCAWGQFVVERQTIHGGIRFTLPNCPNALGWTLTTGHDPKPEKIIIHCTINRTDHDAIFIESIEDFVNAWRRGLEKNLV